MKLGLKIYPNPILEQKCEEVTQFDEQLHKELDEMLIIMDQYKGMGISANQVGLNKRMFIMRDQKGAIIEFINPIIKEQVGQANLNEGCLSAPGIYFSVFSRPQEVTVSFQDRNGNNIEGILEGIEAVCVSHEIDHLNGKFYFDYLSRKDRRYLMKKMKSYK